MTNSRAKGCRGELEAAALLRQYGFEARRGQQFSGSPDSPDIKHSIPGVHIEVKRVEHLSLYKAMEQAEADAPEGSIPVVMHKRNRKPWIIAMGAADFLQLMAAAHSVANDRPLPAWLAGFYGRETNE